MYQLAYQCGVWDIDWFEKTIPPRILDRWMWWFRHRPQGQFHNDEMLSLIASSMLSTYTGKECEPSHFLWWTKKTDEEMSLSEIRQQADAAWEDVRELIPKTQQTIEVKAV